MYYWRAYSNDGVYELDSMIDFGRQFETKIEAYDDMRNEALDKMKWNTEYDEDYCDETETIEYDVCFSQNKIIHNSYSGLYTYEIYSDKNKKGDKEIMNVLDNVYAYVTEEGYKGIIRADSEEEAVKRRYDYDPSDEVKYIVCLSDLDNDYGVIEEHRIDDAIDEQKYIRQYSFDIEGDTDEDELAKIINEAGLGVTVIGAAWQATWKYGDYKKCKPPISSN